MHHIEEAKSTFYKRLEEFDHPNSKIDPRILKRIRDFRSLDWSSQFDLDIVRSYLFSVKPIKQ